MSLFLFYCSIFCSLFIIARCENIDAGNNGVEVPKLCPDVPLLTREALIVEYKGSEGVTRQATFSCIPGYFLVGQASRNCVDGQWPQDLSLPYCLRGCPQPPYLRNGEVEIEGRSFEGQSYPNGTVAHYSCGSEFRLEPAESQEQLCMNGGWTGSTPYCVPRSCDLSDASIADGFYMQDVVNPGLLRLRYGCHSGYALLGSAERSCGQDGEWSPLLPPTCMRLDGNQVVSSAGENDQLCPPPPSLTGVVISRVRGDIGYHAPSGAEIEFRCAEGLRDTQSPCEPAMLRCINGAWHGRAPECAQFSGCLPLPDIPHGALFGPAPDGRYRVGARVAYTCQPGYRLRGQPVFSCETTGCWDTSILPDCVLDSNQPFYLSGLARGWEEYALSPGAALLASLGTALAVMALLMAVCLAVVCRRRSRRTSRSGGRHSSHRHRWPQDHTPEAPVPPPATLLPPDPDRVALIAFADGLPPGQSALPSYEEATRGGASVISGSGASVLYGALHRGSRGPHWTALASGGGGGGRRGRRDRHAPQPPLQDGDTLSHHSLHGCTRQSSSTSHSASLRSCAAMGGSTDTVSCSEGSTAVTLDTVSSNSRDATSLASSGGVSQTGASCRAICGSLASFDTSSVLNTEGVPLLEESELEGAAEARMDEEEGVEEEAVMVSTRQSPTPSNPSGVEIKLRGASPDRV